MGCPHIFLFKMMSNLPDPKLNSTRLSPGVHQLIQKIEIVTTRLSKIAKEEGFEVGDLAKIWVALPLEDNEGITYLEVASQCILEVSGLVDRTFPQFSYSQKIAKKYTLMAGLLKLKAEQLL